MVKLLSGSGIEIGALNAPISNDLLDVTYVDRLSSQELEQVHPDKNGIVNVDVVDNAEVLGKIDDCTQNFVVCINVIEHMRNPIAAFLSWQRVLRVGGRLCLWVPEKGKMFDRYRRLTSLSHFIDDFNGLGDDDEHFLDFATNVSYLYLRNISFEDIERYSLWLKEECRDIHFHTFTRESFFGFVSLARGKGFVMEQVAIANGRTGFCVVFEKPNVY